MRGSVVRFTELFPTVELLELDMNGCNKPALFNMIAGSLHMPALRDLNLHWVNCTATALARILWRHRSTLKDVAFHHVHIREDKGWHLIFYIYPSREVKRRILASCAMLMRKAMGQVP